MYTGQEAREKISSESFRFEEFIDTFLQEHFRGKELMVPVSTWTESIIWPVLDKYVKNGWTVRPQNSGPDVNIGTGNVFFSLPPQ